MAVQNLDPVAVDNAALHKMFAPFGAILSAKVVVDGTSGKSHGNAYVQFAEASSAQVCIPHPAQFCWLSFERVWHT